MKRTMLVMAMVIALTMSAFAPAMAQGKSGHARGAGPPSVIPESTTYICYPTNQDHWQDDWWRGDMTVKVRNHSSVRMGGWATDRTFNGHLVDYSVSYWEHRDGEAIHDHAAKERRSAASANVTCWNENMYGEPFAWYGLRLYIRLGEGQYNRWMDQLWPGWNTR